MDDGKRSHFVSISESFQNVKISYAEIMKLNLTTSDPDTKIKRSDSIISDEKGEILKDLEISNKNEERFLMNNMNLGRNEAINSYIYFKRITRLIYLKMMNASDKSSQQLTLARYMIMEKLSKKKSNCHKMAKKLSFRVRDIFHLWILKKFKNYTLMTMTPKIKKNMVIDYNSFFFNDIELKNFDVIFSESLIGNLHPKEPQMYQQQINSIMKKITKEELLMPSISDKSITDSLDAESLESIRYELFGVTLDLERLNKFKRDEIDIITRNSQDLKRNFKMMKFINNDIDEKNLEEREINIVKILELKTANRISFREENEDLYDILFQEAEPSEIIDELTTEQILKINKEVHKTSTTKAHFPEVKNKEFIGLTKPMDKSHTFSNVFMKVGAFKLKSYFDRKKGGWDNFVRNTVLRVFGTHVIDFERMTSSSLQVYEVIEECKRKDSKLRGKTEEEIWMHMSNSVGREKFNFALSKWIMKKIITLRPYMDVENLVDFTKEEKFENCFFAFAKGGLTTREIFIAHIVPLLLIQLTEKFSRAICKELDSEMLTKGTTKHKLSENHQSKINEIEEQLENDGYTTVTTTFSVSGDKEVWCQKFTPMGMGNGLFHLFSDYPSLLNLMLFIQNLHSEKVVLIPPTMVKSFLSEEKIKSYDESLTSLCEQMRRKYFEREDQSLLGNKVFKFINRSNMMQGVQHYLSSLLHAIVVMVSQEASYIYIMTHNRFEETDMVKVIQDAQVSSDDIGSKDTLIVSFKRGGQESESISEKRKKIKKLSREILDDGKLIMEICSNGIGASSSVPKSTYSFRKLFEFNQEFFMGVRFVKSLLKFVYSLSQQPATSNPRNYIEGTMSVIKSAVERGLGTRNAYKVSYFSMRLNYRMLGLGHTNFFREKYYNSIKKNKLTTLGFFPLVHPMFTGLFPLSFSEFLLYKTNESYRKSLHITYSDENFDVSNEGISSLSIKLSLKKGEKNMKELLSKINCGNYEEIIQNDPILLLTDRVDNVELYLAQMKNRIKKMPETFALFGISKVIQKWRTFMFITSERVFKTSGVSVKKSLFEISEEVNSKILNLDKRDDHLEKIYFGDTYFYQSVFDEYFGVGIKEKAKDPKTELPNYLIKIKKYDTRNEIKKTPLAELCRLRWLKLPVYDHQVLEFESYKRTFPWLSDTLEDSEKNLGNRDKTWIVNFVRTYVEKLSSIIVRAEVIKEVNSIETLFKVINSSYSPFCYSEKVTLNKSLMKESLFEKRIVDDDSKNDVIKFFSRIWRAGLFNMMKVNKDKEINFGEVVLKESDLLYKYYLKNRSNNFYFLDSSNKRYIISCMFEFLREKKKEEKIRKIDINLNELELELNTFFYSCFDEVIYRHIKKREKVFKNNFKDYYYKGKGLTEIISKGKIILIKYVNNKIDKIIMNQDCARDFGETFELIKKFAKDYKLSYLKDSSFVKVTYNKINKEDESVRRYLVDSWGIKPLTEEIMNENTKHCMIIDLRINFKRELLKDPHFTVDSSKLILNLSEGEEGKNLIRLEEISTKLNTSSMEFEDYIANYREAWIEDVPLRTNDVTVLTYFLDMREEEREKLLKKGKEKKNTEIISKLSDFKQFFSEISSVYIKRKLNIGSDIQTENKMMYIKSLKSKKLLEEEDKDQKEANSFIHFVRSELKSKPMKNIDKSSDGDSITSSVDESINIFTVPHSTIFQTNMLDAYYRRYNSFLFSCKKEMRNGKLTLKTENLDFPPHLKLFLKIANIGLEQEGERENKKESLRNLIISSKKLDLDSQSEDYRVIKKEMVKPERKVEIIGNKEEDDLKSMGIKEKKIEKQEKETIKKESSFKKEKKRRSAKKTFRKIKEENKKSQKANNIYSILSKDQDDDEYYNLTMKSQKVVSETKNKREINAGKMIKIDVEKKKIEKTNKRKDHLRNKLNEILDEKLEEELKKEIEDQEFTNKLESMYNAKQERNIYEESSEMKARKRILFESCMNEMTIRLEAINQILDQNQEDKTLNEKEKTKNQKIISKLIDDLDAYKQLSAEFWESNVNEESEEFYESDSD